jgi:hypothetical protein
VIELAGLMTPIHAVPTERRIEIAAASVEMRVGGVETELAAAAQVRGRYRVPAIRPDLPARDTRVRIGRYTIMTLML